MNNNILAGNSVDLVKLLISLSINTTSYNTKGN